MSIPTWGPLPQVITAITNANPGVVTTATSHGYLSGLYVRFYFPEDFGMPELSENVYVIIVLSPTTFSIDENTIGFQPFFISTTKQIPQVVPVAEIASSLLQAERNTSIPIGGGI
jgi:hypothetical protein